MDYEKENKKTTPTKEQNVASCVNHSEQAGSLSESQSVYQNHSQFVLFGISAERDPNNYVSTSTDELYIFHASKEISNYLAVEHVAINTDCYL